MARELTQQMGDAHEVDISEWTKGIQQKSSGNQWHAQGDTKNGEFLVPYPITSDGKSTMGKMIAISRDMWDKIVDQTFNQNPALFLRFYRPDETRLTVDLDLAVTRAGFFTEILEAARKWAQVDDYLSLQGSDVSDVEHVIELIRLGQESRDEVFKDLVQLGQDMESSLYFCPTSEEVESQPGGGFDKCCERSDLHVPLPDNASTDVLSRILDERLKTQCSTGHVYLSTGCFHGEHKYCQSDVGLGGVKVPAQCKFCSTPCICKCHGAHSKGCDCCR